MQISQVILSYSQPISLIKSDEIRYFSQLLSEMFYSLQYDFTKCAPRYKLNSFVTMANYGVPDLPNIKSFLGVTFDIF